MAQGTVLELNTRRLADRTAIKALLPVYKAYADCGGRYATIGSDAHKAGAVGQEFSTARELLEACNLRPVHFKQRKMEYD